MKCNGVNCVECIIKDLCDDIDNAIDGDFESHHLLAEIYNRATKVAINKIKENMPNDICSGLEAIEEIEKILIN